MSEKVREYGNKSIDLIHEEAKKYETLYETILDVFRREYYTETGRIVSETQTGAIISLYFNLAREKDGLATGFVGTPSNRTDPLMNQE